VDAFMVLQRKCLGYDRKIREKPQLIPLGTNVNKSLSWHLATEAQIALYGNSNIANRYYHLIF